jgi:uncharacterized protein (TIRG00374 family)
VYPQASPFARRQKLALAATISIYLIAGAALYALTDSGTLQRARALPASLIAQLLALSLVNYALRAWRWIVLSGRLGLRVSPLTNALYYLAGFSLTSTPGKAGEAVRLWFLRSGHQIPYARSTPLILADRVIDMWAVLILVAGSMVEFGGYGWQMAAVVALVGMASMPILFPRRLDAILDWAHRRAPKRTKVIAGLRTICASLVDLRGWRSYGLTLLPSVVGWLAEGAALHLLLQHLGSDLSLSHCIFVFAFGVAVGAVSLLPGGIGSTEATMIVLLRAFGVSMGVAGLATAVVRITTLWFAVAIGILLMPLATHVSARSGRLAASGHAGGN